MTSQNTLFDTDFIKCFTIACIKAVEQNEFNIPPTKIIIDSDLVPEISEQLIREYTLNEEVLKKLREFEGLDFLESSAQRTPTQYKVPVNPRPHPQPNIQSQSPPQVKAAPQTLPTDEVKMGNGYLKIKPYIDDYTISRIQCIGPNKPIILIKTGQKQVTKTILSAEEVQDVFAYITDSEHIPLIEGPIRINSKDITLNGLNSKLTDSKFIIQKNTAYAMLEGKTKPGAGPPPRRSPIPQQSRPSNRPNLGIQPS